MYILKSSIISAYKIFIFEKISKIFSFIYILYSYIFFLLNKRRTIYIGENDTKIGYWDNVLQLLKEKYMIIRIN